MEEVTKTEITFKTIVILLMTLGFLLVLGRSNPWIPGLDDANLIIHESGHVFLAGFGELISAFGGTFMQMVIPGFFVAYFAYKKDYFSCGFATFWLGENLLNISVYIKDARTMILPLINEGTHDWNKILSITGGLKLDGFLGNFTAFAGYILMTGSIGYCGYQLFERLKQRAAKPIL